MSIQNLCSLLLFSFHFLARPIPAEAAKGNAQRPWAEGFRKSMKPWLTRALAPITSARTLGADAYRQCCFQAAFDRKTLVRLLTKTT